jgi:hypothetical protein
MTENHFKVYQFMVSKFGGVFFDSMLAFEEGVRLGKATKRFIPGKTWGMYNIDSQELMAEGYLCRYGFDLIKVKNGNVAEYYRRLISNEKYCFIAYDIDTLAPIESYSNIGNQLHKFDWNSGDLKQKNNNCTYDSLPDDFREATKHLTYKRHIFMYAIKPYGRVVEFYYP